MVIARIVHIKNPFFFICFCFSPRPSPGKPLCLSSCRCPAILRRSPPFTTKTTDPSNDMPSPLGEHQVEDQISKVHSLSSLIPSRSSPDAPSSSPPFLLLPVKLHTLRTPPSLRPFLLLVPILPPHGLSSKSSKHQQQR